MIESQGKILNIRCGFLTLVCFSAQLDGVSEKARKRLAEHHNINDWLELEESSQSERDKHGKRRVSQIWAFDGSHSCATLPCYTLANIVLKRVLYIFVIFL